MSEQSLSCEDHGHTVFVRGLDDFDVAHRAAGLNDGLGARLGGGVAVPERKERIGGLDGAFEFETGVRRFLHREA